MPFYIYLFFGSKNSILKGTVSFNLHFLFTFYWNSILKGTVSYSFNSRWARLDCFVEKKYNNMINIFKSTLVMFIYITFLCTIGCLDKLLIALKKLHPCSDLYTFQEINYFIGTIRALKYKKNEGYLIFTNKIKPARVYFVRIDIYVDKLFAT